MIYKVTLLAQTDFWLVGAIVARSELVATFGSKNDRGASRLLK